MNYKDFYINDKLLTEVKMDLEYDVNNESVTFNEEIINEAVLEKYFNWLFSTEDLNDLVNRIKKIPQKILLPMWERWFSNEKNTSWINKLPECPCQLKMDGGNVVNPDPKNYENPAKISGILATLFHPGATWELRSKGIGDLGQQCCYDNTGKLITGGNAAGTADKVSPSVSVGKHFKADVIPFLIAKALDGFKSGGEFVKKYIDVRPTNDGENCPANIKEISS